MSDERGVYTAAEVCDLLGISDNFLRSLVRDRAHPPPFRELKLGAAFRDADIEFLEDADDLVHRAALVLMRARR